MFLLFWCSAVCLHSDWLSVKALELAAFSTACLSIAYLMQMGSLHPAEDAEYLPQSRK